MNLHAIVAPAISVVNPMVPCIVRINTGNATDARGVTTPTYAPDVNMMAQVQSSSNPELTQMQGLNLSKNTSNVYLFGSVTALNRNINDGGDLLIFGGQVWLVVQVMESWPDWCKLAVTLQRDAP